MPFKDPKQRRRIALIRCWKKQGILYHDYNQLYHKFINTSNCELCNIKLTTDRYIKSTTRVCDHDHSITDNDNVRNIICQKCNRQRDALYVYNKREYDINYNKERYYFSKYNNQIAEFITTLYH